MKTSGLVVLKGAGRVFEGHVRRLLRSNAGLAQIILPVLEAWRTMRARVAELGKQLVASARASEKCQLLSSIPGFGAVTASSFVAAIEDPENFKNSRAVGAWIGLTTRRYQSGEVDYGGHISRRGDNHLRGLLNEAVTVILIRTRADSALRIWGLKLKKRSASSAPPSRFPQARRYPDKVRVTHWKIPANEDLSCGECVSTA